MLCEDFALVAASGDYSLMLLRLLVVACLLLQRTGSVEPHVCRLWGLQHPGNPAAGAAAPRL